MKTFIFGFLSFLLSLSAMAQFQAGERVNIDENKSDDFYAAGGEVYVDASINGDLIAAGGELTIKDSVFQDATLAGGQIEIDGYIGDDLRIAGGDINIKGLVKDDVIVFGGDVVIEKSAEITGSLISFTGNIDVYGKVSGAIIASGGIIRLHSTPSNIIKLEGEKVIIDNTIYGTAQIVAEEIELGPNARFESDVEYWARSGEIDFSDHLKNGARAKFNPNLSISPTDTWEDGGGIWFVFWLVYIPALLLVIFTFHLLFSKQFKQTSQWISEDWGKSLGYGFIYLVGIPCLILLLMIIVVGIPIGLFLLIFYLFSLVFALSLTALVTTYFVQHKKGVKWTNATIIFISLGIAVVLRLISFIPFVGFIILLFSVAMAFGALVQVIIESRKAVAPNN